MLRTSAQALKKNALKSTPPNAAADDVKTPGEQANAAVESTMDAAREESLMSRIESANREDLIRQAAYRRFKERGTPHGDEVQDWLEAEAEINQSLVE